MHRPVVALCTFCFQSFCSQFVPFQIMCSSPSDEWNADVEVTRNNAKLLDANTTNQAVRLSHLHLLVA
jgi:hypothetical protein